MLGARLRRAPTHPRPAAAARATPRTERDSTAVRTGIRPFILLAVMAISTAGLVARLTYWQVLQHGHLASLAATEYAAVDVQTPLRGQIYDATGELLATDVTKYEVDAVPKQIKDPRRTAALMAPPLHESEKTVFDKITMDARIVLLGPPLSAHDGQTVRNLALPGIILTPEPRRTYPQGVAASQVLGFTDSGLAGQYGIEGYYNNLLTGTAGVRSVLKDTAGNDIRISSAAPSPTRNGAELHLSLNGMVQGVVEDELSKAVTQHGASAGTAIVMDPRTGYILGMASTPTYNPNQYYNYPAGTYANPAIQWMYEPGSTMKVLTMAAGLDSGAITPQSALDDTGSFVVGNQIIHNWNQAGFGYENMTQVLQHSANVGASWVAQRLGVNRFYSYMRRFQMNRPTGVDLQGEESGLMPFPGDRTWTIYNLYTNSFGQGLLITPLRLMTSIGAVANGGVMMKPQVVKQLIYDGRVIDHQPVSEGRVIKASTARTLTSMLVHSAIAGEAQMALVKGYNIAAKTGTASVADGHGGYLTGVTIASTIAYAPAYHPRFLVLVVLNHPRDQIWGSMTAAPTVHNIMQDLFTVYRIPPNPHPVPQ